MRAKGILVVNSFLKNAKFGELYGYLNAAAQKSAVILRSTLRQSLFLALERPCPLLLTFAFFGTRTSIFAVLLKVRAYGAITPPIPFFGAMTKR